MAAASTESSVSSDQKVQEPANNIRHPRWPEWTNASPDAGLKLPELEGEENFEDWETEVLYAFELYGLEGFVKGTETPPPSDIAEDRLDLRRFQERRLCAFRIIWNSSEPIRRKLALYGYNGARLPDDLDPKPLWDAIQRWDATHNPFAKVKLVRELGLINHSQFKSLREFLDRAYWLRQRLERVGVPIADELMKTYLLSGLTTYEDENWATSLVIQASDWDYCTLVEEIESKASWEFLMEIHGKPRKPQHIKRHGRHNARGRRSGQRKGARQRARY